jgi:hypothetical protein
MANEARTTISVERAEVFLRWIYESRGIAMLTKAARADFIAHAAEDRRIAALPSLAIRDIPVTKEPRG